MRFRQYISEWNGAVLVALVAVHTLWLAGTHQLELYIHPRYVVFSIGMSLISIAAIGASIVTWRAVHTASAPWPRMVLGVAVVVVVTGLLFGLRPSTLTSATAVQRGLNAGSVALPTSSTASQLFKTNNYDTLTVKDWAALFAQTADPSFFAGKRATMTGFVSPDPLGRKNVLYVSRFVIACCAVDATPVGVPVYQPGWEQSFPDNSWIDVTGTYQTVHNAAVLVPETIKKVAQPREPYVY